MKTIMKLTNYDGTEASETAYNIQGSIDLIRNETIPQIRQNPSNFGNRISRIERIKALNEYVRKLQHDLGVELGNDKAWENV